MVRFVRSTAFALAATAFALTYCSGAAAEEGAPRKSKEAEKASPQEKSSLDARLDLEVADEEPNAVTAFLDDGSLPALPEFSELPQAAVATRMEFRDWIREEIDPPGPFLHEDRVDLRAPVSVSNSMIPQPEGWLVDLRFMTTQANGWIQGGNPLADEEVSTSWGSELTSAGNWATDRRIYDRHIVDLTYAIQRGVGVYIRPQFESETLRQRSFASGSSARRSYGESGISEVATGALIDVYDDPQNVVVLQLGTVAPVYVVSGYRPSWALDAPAGTTRDDWFTPDWRVQPAVTYKHYGKWWSGGAQWLSDWELSGSPTSGVIDQSTHVNVWFSYLLDSYKTLAFTMRGEAVWREVGHEDRIPPSLALSDPRLQDGQTFNLGYGLMFQLPMGGRLNLEMAHLLYQYSPDVQIQDQFALAASYSKTF
ncbi:MAG TPA: hypothetical protein VGN57_00840 [Pirellulaceae bacterium]|jgi:hypothetical protein|nr:hypothetical protein [Pirellulaceae bacterium]